MQRLGMIVLVVGACVLAVRGPWTARAQEKPDETAALGKRQAAFLGKLQEGEVEAAYTELLAGSPVSGDKQQVDNLVQQTARGIKLYGGPTGHTVQPLRRLDSRLVYSAGIVYTQRAPLFFYFVWYRPAADAAWRIQSTYFNDNVREFHGWARR